MIHILNKINPYFLIQVKSPTHAIIRIAYGSLLAPMNSLDIIESILEQSHSNAR